MKGANSFQGDSKQEADALMEYLRKNPPQVKSIDEVVNLLHVISAEQRSNNVLRSCVDKVLMNMSNIRTLRDIIERLRSVSRTNGFRFELPASSSPETRCRLVSDMFSVKIILGTSNTPEHSPMVLDVSIQHKERDEYKTCPHLVNVIRSGNFLELSSHLKGLTEMYLTSGSKHNRIRVFMALQSLETDLVKMSQVYRETHKEASCLDVAMEGTVGMLIPRIAGDRSYFAYYISPYDLIDTAKRGRITLGETVPKHIGLHAEVGIEQRSATCNLPITPLITNKHPVDNTGVARFLDINQHNSMTVPLSAAFVLYLKPAVPVLSNVAEAIKKITNLNVSSEDNTSKPYLELLDADKKIFKIPVGDEKHIYHLNLSNLRGTLVNKIFFTHPGHVTEILDQLRKQAHLNTLISSCIRENCKESKKEKEWYFEVSCSHVLDRINVTMEHPSANGTAFLEIRLDKSGFKSCKIFTGRGDPPLCTDEFVAKVLRKCSSLPITMRKLIEQTIKNPKKQTEVKRARPLFAPPPTHLPAQALLLTPVQKLPPPQPRPLSASTAPTFPNPNDTSAFNLVPTETEQEQQKKVVKNPLLTHLLIPDTNEAPVQMKNHPMLMGLLKEESDREQNPVLRPNLSRGGKTPNTSIGYQQLSMGGNQQNQYSAIQGSPMGFMSPNAVYPGLEPPIPVPVSHTMPPPSYPSQYGGSGQLPNMSPAQHSPANIQQFQRSPMGGIDDMSGPVTPTHFGMMSPGLVSPGANMQSMGRGRRASRQKSHSVENPDFGSFDLPQDAFQQPMGMDAEIMALQNRAVRRTDSMSPGVILSSHLPLQHSTSLKSISESIGNSNPLQRSVSSGSGKGSTRSMASPRNLRTPEAMLSFDPMFDNFNQRGSRGKSFDSHSSDFFRSSFASESPGGNAFGLNSGAMSDKDIDVFAFDERKPSKISMTDNTSGGAVQRNTKPPLYHSTSTDKDETLRDLVKNKPALLKALTGDIPAVKFSEVSRQLSISTAGLMPTLTSIVATHPASSSDLTKRLMTSTSVTTVAERNLVRQNAVDKQLATNMQSKAGEINKGEKQIRRRNSSKNEDGKAPAKKRGRPPTVKDHAGKRKKTDTSTPSMQDDAGSNASITLNIQLSSTGTPISSTTKTKPIAGTTPPQIRNQQTPEPVGPTIVGSTPSSAAAGNPATGPAATPDLEIEKYLRSQHELQKRKKEINKDKKGNVTPTEKVISGSQTGKPLGSVSPRSGGVVVPQKRPRKPTTKLHDVIDKLALGKTPSTTDIGKQSVEKDANSNLLTKSKSLIGSPTYPKTLTNVPNKISPKPSIEDKVKTGTAVKAVIHSKGSLSKTQQDATVKPSGIPPGVGLVLQRINETAAATTKRVMPTPLNKGQPAKLPRTIPPAKARSATPTSTIPMNPAQRKSPQLLKGLTSDASIRQGPAKQTTNMNPGVKKSPVRLPIAGGPIRPSSAPSGDTSTTNPPKTVSTSPTMAMMSRKPHSTTPIPGDQHFITPSISPTPKRTSSPQISRTTSPLTRVDDKTNKGMPGRSPHRPSPTHSRISTPVPSSNPQSPDGGLVIIDDSTMTASGTTTGSTLMTALSRDEQRPVFIPGAKTHERQSPERTVMPSPLSPPQQKNPNMLQAAKRTSTSRYTSSPGMSPMMSSASPYPIDDDLMNQAVTG